MEPNILRNSQHTAKVILVALTLIMSANQVGAQGGAALVDPSSKLYTVTSTGEGLSGSLRVTNPAPTPIRLRLYLSDFTLDLDGQFTFSAVDSEKRSASSWVSFTTSVLDLGPHETRTVPYTVNVPAGAAAGTHWTVLFVEGEPSDPVPGRSGASISVRVGHIIYVNVPELSSAGAIAGMFGDPPTEPGRPYVLMTQYANTGNAAQGVEGTFVVRNDHGEAVIEADVERSVVLPGTDRAFQVNVFGPLPAGNYTALMVLNYGDEDRDVAGTYDFTLEEALAEPGTQQP